jgi:hypothetical protein
MMEEEEQQTIEFFCNNCSCKLHTVEGDDAAHCYHCSSTWSISKDNLRTIGLRVTEQESLDDSDTGTQETLISVIGDGDTQSVNDDTKPKLHGALASLQENSGTVRVYDYTEKGGSA